MARGARGISHREWQISREDYGDDQSFREAVQAELAMCENIGERLGVAIVASPVRTKQGQSWFTMGWRFQTASVPAWRGGEEDVIGGTFDDLEAVTVPDSLPEDE